MGIIVPILTVIISFSGSWIIAHYQTKLSEQQFYENQILTRIEIMQTAINYCNITEKQVHDNLAKARYYWSSRNYTMTEKYLDIVINNITVRNCFVAPKFSPISGIGIWFLVLIAIITIFVVIVGSAKRDQKPLDFHI